MTDTANPTASHPLPPEGWATVDDQRLVRIAGPGTDKFLQGQFSQNLADVTAAFSPRAAACTPKGRAYCLTRLVRDADDVLMTVPASLFDTITGQLRKYLMLFRGTSMDALDDARVIGILGDDLIRLLAPDSAHELDRPGASVTLGAHHLIRTENTADGQARYEFWQLGELSGEQAQAFKTVSQQTLADWHASEIAAGIASLSPESLEAYVPQMLNWQHVGGVHFKKGCYTGQEVIARMHFLGQLKKSLFRFSIDPAPDTLAPGTVLLAEERPAGEVVNSIHLADGTAQCLAVVRHDRANEELRLESLPDADVRRLELPYPVPEQEKGRTPDT